MIFLFLNKKSYLNLNEIISSVFRRIHKKAPQ